MMTLEELIKYLPEAELRGLNTSVFKSISTDSRACGSQSLFFALRGERFDGHAFAAEVRAAGTVAMVVERWLATDIAQIKVPNVKRALGQLAGAWRNHFDIPVIAVAGSNGKTTVTQMIASILEAAFGGHCLATKGNLNNDIGLPLMLSQLSPAHKAAVFELGMNHPGEMSYLAELAQPTIAVITNAQREHQEFLATVEATAHENGAVLTALPENGIAVLPSDDACVPIWREMACGRQVMDFSLSVPARVHASYELIEDGASVSAATPVGIVNYKLSIPGSHNVKNSLAALTAALAAGINKASIIAGLQAFSPLCGRGARRRLASGALIIDETYNANPDSVLAALDTLALQRGERTFVLGDMGETGDNGPAFHAEAGRYALEKGIDRLLAAGELSRYAVTAFNSGGGASGQYFENQEELIAAASRIANGPNAILLVKGSRFMRMEKVIQALSAETEETSLGLIQAKNAMNPLE